MVTMMIMISHWNLNLISHDTIVFFNSRKDTHMLHSASDLQTLELWKASNNKLSGAGKYSK
jgi:hypothetical protein